MVLMSNVSGEAAVDEYIHTFPALTDLDRESRWFRPTMAAIATELMHKVAYGVKVRAGLGASVSILDLVSDTVIILEYVLTGRTGFAYLMFGMVAANLALQLFLVWLQTQGLKENKWRTMMTEMLATVLFLKPGLDAWKVASGAEEKAGAAMVPLMEMTTSKSLEMVFESIPGFLLQSMAILSAKDRSATAVISLLISAAATGLTATTMFYDVDVDPGMRKRNPIWCGVIPDQGRGVAFATVFTFCTLHVLAKGVATALLFIVNPFYLTIFFAVDYVLYFGYFISRKDVVYYVPMPPVTSVVVSSIVRVLLKIIGDFSGAPALRLPLLLGGSYYIFNLITAQVSVFVAVYLYNTSAVDITVENDDGTEEVVEKVNPDTLAKLATALVVAWIFAMSFFLFRVVTPSHRHTFWSKVSGRQCVKGDFSEGTTDECRLEIFSCNRMLWESDIGPQVKEFTHQNWARWERENPSWFTSNLKATVPDEYIPRESLAALGGARRERRGSAAGSVRESFRLS
jgi:hypothetical protein